MRADFLSAERMWMVLLMDFLPRNFSRLLQSGSWYVGDKLQINKLFLTDCCQILGYLRAGSLGFDAFFVEISIVQEL